MILDVAFNLYTTDPKECSSLSKVANDILSKVITTLDSPASEIPLPISGASSTTSVGTSSEESAGAQEGVQASICPPMSIATQDNLDSDTVTTATAKRNFSTWTKMLNLPVGYTLYHNTTHYRFSLEKGRACLITLTAAGKTITGYSPSGAIKAYLKSNGSNQQVDGWKKLSMYNEEGRLLPICWSGWLARQWNPSTKTFQVMDSV